MTHDRARRVHIFSALFVQDSRKVYRSLQPPAQLVRCRVHVAPVLALEANRLAAYLDCLRQRFVQEAQERQVHRRLRSMELNIVLLRILVILERAAELERVPAAAMVQ